MVFDNVKKLADEKGWSIRELERRAGVTNGVVAKWKGKENAKPSADSVRKVARALNVSMATIIKEEQGLK